ncbi:hypothetical protein RUM43_001704 [Polyplax serrata]|uniref:Uncharacterized protein n=1 Tax=Polyplax serrata TaxID=468196 RepID=A0AAN8SID5_POLSC
MNQLVAYIIAFTIELWWILDSSGTITLSALHLTLLHLPHMTFISSYYSTVPPSVGAYLLCTGYFVLFASAGVLLRGLSIVSTTERFHLFHLEVFKVETRGCKGHYRTQQLVNTTDCKSNKN